jgi:hypothetical protein
MDLPTLDAAEVRVLGSLLEKDLTTPEYYPLSLNALVNACNQSNNREPVVSYGEADVTRAMDRLRDQRLAAILSGGENRVTKFRHLLADAFELPRPELGVLCVLLLRGPQTPGELRGRTGRMHEFVDLAEVQACLGTLAARPTPLVAVLPRQPGTKESRYTHLLAGGVDSAAPTSAFPSAPAASEMELIPRLEAELATVKRELADLREQFAVFRKQFE